MKLTLLPRQLRIPPGARVLEIGSGGRPHHRSTVLLDRFALDTSHREGKPLIRDGRPLVVADGEQLPFADHAFDYCICMHVLEHVDHPDRLLREMQRVARAGYIETPTELFDWLFAVEPFTIIHKWFVNLDHSPNGLPTLLLERKTPANSRHRFGPLLDHLRRHDPHFERWMEKHPDLFTVQYEWTGEVHFRILDPPPEDSSPLLSPDEYLTRRSSPSAFYWGTGTWGLKRWLYSWAVHPTLRKWAKRLLGRRP